jgi:hypothetical protein
MLQLLLAGLSPDEGSSVLGHFQAAFRSGGYIYAGVDEDESLQEIYDRSRAKCFSYQVGLASSRRDSNIYHFDFYRTALPSDLAGLVLLIFQQMGMNLTRIVNALHCHDTTISYAQIAFL